MQRLALIFLLLVASNECSAQEPERSGGDFRFAAAELAPQIAQKVVAKQGTARFRVAVFPVGNRHGQVTIDTYEGATVLQGELIFQLIGHAKGKFLVLDKAGLRKEFQTAGIDPAGITANKPKETSQILQKTGIDAAVIGSFDSLGHFAALREGQVKIHITLTVVYKDGSFDQVSASSIPESDPIPPPINPELSGRFRVEMLLRKDGKLQPIPLLTSKNPDSKYHGVFFAVVPKGVKLGTDKAEFVVRLINKGTPPVSPLRMKDRHGVVHVLVVEAVADRSRLFAAAVLVDGVNSIYQDIGNGETGPVVVHPRCAKKWILCGPGQGVVPDNNKKEGYRLVNVKGEGGSKVDVVGYQHDNETAAAFTFANPGEGLAEKIGITNDLGMIAVYFYAQKLDSDKLVAKVGADKSLRPNVTVKEGRSLLNPVFGIRPDLYANPVEVWRIFYRSEEELPKDFPNKHRIPITGGPFKMEKRP